MLVGQKRGYKLSAPEHAYMWLWGLEAHTSSGLSPGSKVVSLFRRDCGVVFSLSSTRANMEGNPGALGSGDVSSTLDMVLQVRCTGVSALAGWNICDGVVRTAGPWEGGNIPVVCRVPVAPAWRAYVGACLSVAAFLAPCWGSCRSLSTWTCKRDTEGARALMLFMIWSS